MKTTITKTGKGILLTTLIVFGTIYAKAEGESMFMEIVSKNISGIYIIGGVLGFGLVLLLITKIVSRYTKNEEVIQNNTHTISHRHKHHHKVIKKSS